jgi:hypothetical protein
MCSIDGCEKPVAGRGWCWMHYERWLRHGDPLIVLQHRSPVPLTCKVEGCQSRTVARGWCSAHYSRFMRLDTLSQINVLLGRQSLVGHGSLNASAVAIRNAPQ